MEAEVAYFSDDIEGARAAFKRALEIEPEVSRISYKYRICSREFLKRKTTSASVGIAAHIRLN